MWHSVRFFFVEFKKRTHETYPQLFSKRDEKDDYSSASAFGEKWGWYSCLYSLSSESITKLDQVERLGVNTCLTWLTFVKEKNELERQQIRNARKK